MLRSPYERKRLKIGATTVSRDFRFWLSLLREDAVSIGITILSILLLVFFFLLKKIPVQYNSIALSLFIAIAFPIFIGLIRRFAKYGEIFERVDNKTLWIIEKLIEFTRDISDEKCTIVKHFYDKYPKNFGGIIIGAEEREYLEQLSELLLLSRECFYATLRGGEKPVYSIRWFFTNSDTFASKEKLEYLRAVNNANHIRDRIRILLFKYDELKDFCDDNIRNTFLELNKNVKLYLADPAEVQKYLIENNVCGVTLTRRETSFIWEDYAIFDK